MVRVVEVGEKVGEGFVEQGLESGNGGGDDGEVVFNWGESLVEGVVNVFGVEVFVELVELGDQEIQMNVGNDCDIVFLRNCQLVKNVFNVVVKWFVKLLFIFY